MTDLKLDKQADMSKQESQEGTLGQRISKIRDERGLSMEDLASRTGLDLELLKKMEREEYTPPIGTITKLAKALEIKTDYFVSRLEDVPYTIVRKDDRKLLSAHDSEKSDKYGYEFCSLAPFKRDRHMEPFLIILEPSDIEEQCSTHDGQEFIYVLEGTLEVHLEKDIHLLEPGDAIYYDGTVPHLVKCHGNQAAQILAVLYPEEPEDHFTRSSAVDIQEKRISIIFDPEKTDREDVIEFLESLSNLYRALGGDGLVVRESRS